MTNQEQAYKETLCELLDAYEKVEPIVQKAKQALKEMSQEEYIKTMEEQNRILKERVQLLEDGTLTSSSTCPWDSYSNTTQSCPFSFSWNSFITFVIFLWVFLVFLGF